MGRIAEWEISDFEAEDEVAFIQIEPGLAERRKRAARRPRSEQLTGTRWRPLAVNAACAAVGAIATMLALGSPRSVDGHGAGVPDVRVSAAEQSAIAAAESSTLSGPTEADLLDADPVQNAVWKVLFGPGLVTDAFPDVSGLALAAYWARS